MIYFKYTAIQVMKFVCVCSSLNVFSLQSVEFHEKGKRHQENVKNRISEVKFIFYLYIFVDCKYKFCISIDFLKYLIGLLWLLIPSNDWLI